MPSTATLVAPPGRATQRQPRRGLVLGDHPGRPADGRPRRHHREHRPARHRRSAALLAGEPVVGDHRLHPRLRRASSSSAPGPATCSAAGGCSSRASGSSPSASFLGGLAPWSGWLLAARALQGVGGALAAPSALALLMTMFRDGQERVRAIGWYAAVSIGGGAVGLILGGLLVQWASWRWVLFVNVPIGIVVHRAGAPSADRDAQPQRALRRAAARSPRPSASPSLAYGFVRAATLRLGRHADLGAFAVGVVLLAAVRADRAARALSRSRRCASSPTAAAAPPTSRGSSSIAGMFGMFFFLTQFLQDVLTTARCKTGLAFLPFTWRSSRCRSSARGGWCSDSAPSR